MNQDEKPYIVTYWGKEIQLNEAEQQTLVKAVTDKNQYAFLKDGRILNTKFQSLEPNPHYVSPESIIWGRKKRAALEEYQFLKREGQLTTWDEYVVWKKKSVAQNKALEEYLKEPAKGEENEEERTA